MRRELLASAAEMARPRERISRKPFDHIYERLQRRCAMILESQPITETTWRSAYVQGRWGAASAAVASIQGRVFDLVLSHRIDPNVAYRDRALEEMKNLAGFSTWVDPSHGDVAADTCTGEACATLAIALDWLADELGEPDRIRCLKALREKGLAAYHKAVDSGAFWYSCYHSWNAVVNCGAGLAGLLLGDEEQIGSLAVAKAKAGLRHFFNALGREGGWDEGTGYWGHAMRYVLLFAQALLRTGNDRGIFRRRGMDNTGLFPIYFSPLGVPMSFGDRPMLPAWGVFYLIVKHYGLKEMCWWLDQYAFRHDVTAGGYSDAGLALLFRPEEWEERPAPDLSPVKVFNEIGWVAGADRWPAPKMYVAFKTGDLSAHHAQFDMNSVQLMVNGEILLHDAGSPDYTKEYLSPEQRGQFYEVQARAHNTVTIAQREHRIDAVGSIIEAQDAPRHRWIAGDAGTALGDDVHFIRHVVMPVHERSGEGRMLIVLDEVRNVVPEKIAATWHTAGTVAIRPGKKGGKGAKLATIAGQAVTLHAAFAASCPVTVATSKPESRPGDTVITVETRATAEAVMLSVFSPAPLGKVALTRSSRGDVTAEVGAFRLHWKVSRRNHQLESVQEIG